MNVEVIYNFAEIFIYNPKITMEKFTSKKYLRKDLENQIKYLNLLADRFPNVQSASTEVINLEAILNLPKGTEHFLSDIHELY